MSGSVETDLMRHQQALDADEAADDALTAVADALARRWYGEYLIDGRIEFLDWDVDDLTVLLFQRKASSVFEVLADEAIRAVQADPSRWMPEPDFSQYEWD